MNPDVQRERQSFTSYEYKEINCFNFIIHKIYNIIIFTSLSNY